MEKPATISAHHGPLTSVAFAPHVQTLVSGDTDNKTQLWAVPAWQPLEMPQDDENAVDTLFPTSGWSVLDLRNHQHHREPVACKSVLWWRLHEVPFECAQPRRWKAVRVAGGGVVQ
jgi:WD40 repeat protein